LETTERWRVEGTCRDLEQQQPRGSDGEGRKGKEVTITSARPDHLLSDAGVVQPAESKDDRDDGIAGRFVALTVFPPQSSGRHVEA
jgi:hypothetical protein